jgi:hypothetical protein
VSKNEGGILKNEGEVSKHVRFPQAKVTPSIEPRNGDIQNNFFRISA